MEEERESVKLSLTNELIRAACIYSMRANTHNQDYVTNSADLSSSEEVLVIAFRGSLEVNGFYQDDHFGETKVDLNQFPSLQRIGEGQPAKVNGSFLKTFQDLLNNSGFKSEVEKAVEGKRKKILLSGHSSGGAIASLATLWMFDEYTRKRKAKLSIGCVTFGSPLLGDGTLTHALRREKWACHFTHFVMEHDIVPRMMLAPKTSIQQHLPNILDFYQQNVLIDGSQAVEFFENVLVNASTVASHDAYDFMEPTNSLKEKLSADFVKVSPYRPFGVYVFCTQGESTAGQQLVVENPNAALQLLCYFLQLPNDDQDLAQFSLESLNENLSYEEEVNNNGLQLENRVSLEGLNKHLWTSEGTIGGAVRTHNKALFKLPASAKWCLLAVEESEKRKEKNAEDIKKSMKNYTSTQTTSSKKNVEDMLKEIHEYKKHGNGNNDYYQAFKLQNEHTDFEANVTRLEQAKIWDVVIEMVMRKDLPDEFEVEGDVVKLATEFRRLYEPLDIANFYRHDKGDDTGKGYMEVRPKRYKFTQRWYQHANAMGFESGSESNFVADVEELMIAVRKLKKVKTTEEVTKTEKKVKTIEEVKEELESIKQKVEKWQCDEKIVKKDVFWGESVLSKLHENLANYI